MGLRPLTPMLSAIYEATMKQIIVWD